MQNKITVVYCSLQVEGTHCWADCPIKEVDYLRDRHRHMFHIKVYTEVFHDDRDVEFIELKHNVQDFLQQKYYDVTTRLHEFGRMSCEMIAQELIETFHLCQAEVNEDGENGAIVYV